MTTSDNSPSGIRVSLHNADLWNKFYPMNEMVVTKKGRKTFPDLDVNIEGLVPDALYTISLYLERIGDYRYKFSTLTGQWEKIGKGDKDLPVDKKQHKDGGMAGEHWMKRPVSFSYIHMTNDQDYEKKSVIDDMILVSSMHKYQPVITVKRLSDGKEEEFRLTMTEFMVVTTYQNRKLVELKKTLNKHSARFTDRAPGGKKGASTSNIPAPVKKISTGPMTPPAITKTSSTMTTVTPGLNHFQNHMMTPPAMVKTPSTMITPPSMAPTPVTTGLNNFQNQMMTPPARTPYSMQTPPSMFPTPITPSTMTPPSMGFRNFQNPQNMVAPSNDYTNPYWTPYGTWNMPQMTGGAPAQPQWNMMNAQFGHPGSMPQNNNYNGNDMSFLHGATAADFDFRF
ncbi:unnamed protein product [Caenorhabditis brenneri]